MSNTTNKINMKRQDAMTDTQMTKYLRDRRKSEFIEPLDERPGHMPGARCQNPSCLYIKTTRPSAHRRAPTCAARTPTTSRSR